jgi:hypothetical protein
VTVFSEGAVHKKLFGVLYTLNIIAQAFFSLVFPAAIFAGVAWLAVEYWSAPGWVYAPAILLGLLLGFYSMIKFVLAAMTSLERLENEQKKKETPKRDTKENR